MSAFREMHASSSGKLSSSRIHTTISLIVLLGLLIGITVNVCLKNTEHLPVLIESVCALIAAVLGVRVFYKKTELEENRKPVSRFDTKIFAE